MFGDFFLGMKVGAKIILTYAYIFFKSYEQYPLSKRPFKNKIFVFCTKGHVNLITGSIFCKMQTGGGFTTLSPPSYCKLYDEHLSGKKNKNTYFHQQSRSV